MNTTDTVPGTPDPDQPTGAKVFDFPVPITDTADDDRVLTAGDVVDADQADDELPPAPVDPTGPETDDRPLPDRLAALTAGRRPVLAPWLRSRAELAAVVKWAATHTSHVTAYHTVRVPTYVGKLALRSPRGALRVIVHTAGWAFDADGQALRRDAIERRDHEAYLKLKAAQPRGRLLLVLIAALTITAGGLVLAGWAPWYVRDLVICAVVALLGKIGTPADKAVLGGRAVVTHKAQRLTSDIVVRALGALGIGQINQAMAKGGGGITFPAPIVRDGPGWRAEIDLPYGVTVTDVMDRRDKLASGLRRPLGCVWPEPVHDQHAGRLVLWVGDQDMGKAKPHTWPLAKSGKADLFKAVPFGTDQRGRPVGVDLMYTNVLIGAMPGAGKTFALRVLLLAAALDSNAQLWLYELKGSGDLDAFEPVAHRYTSGPDDDAVLAALEGLRAIKAELLRRIKTINKLPRELRPENKVTPELAGRRNLGLFPLVAAIDECQNLFGHDTYGKEAGELAESIIKLGRAFGVILLLATQRPDRDSLPTGVSANVGVRFCLRVMGQTENDMVLGTSMYKNGVRATVFTRHDRGIGYLVGASDDPQIVRGDYVDNPAAGRIITRARVLRQAAGTLSGHAIGEAPAESDRTDTLLIDILTVTDSDETKVWNETVVDRLAGLRPEVYGVWASQEPAAKTAQLTAALKPYGVATKQVWGTDSTTGKGANRMGITREHITAAVAERDRNRAGG